MKIEGYPEIITEGYPKVMLCWINDESKAKEYLVTCKVPDADDPYKIINDCGLIGAFRYVKDLPNTKPRTIEDGLVEGNIIVRNSDERLILGVCGKAIFPSRINDFTTACSDFYMLCELIEAGWKLKVSSQTESIPEMTMEEVCKALGKEVKIIK